MNLSSPLSSPADTDPYLTEPVALTKPGFRKVQIPQTIDIHHHAVTVALVAPKGTTPNFSAEEARAPVELLDRFFDHETQGALRLDITDVID